MFQLPSYDNHFAAYVEKCDYQLPKLEQALKHCTRFGLALDIGAHCGFFTHNLSPRFKQVESFEPCPDNFRCLRQNSERLTNVNVHNVALGDAPAELYMTNEGFPDGDITRNCNSGGWYVTSHPTKVQVSVLTLDEYELAPDFIKIDVQGYELLVLKGGKQTILKHKPIILIELMTKAHGLDTKSIEYLVSELGMVQLQDMHKDKVYGFPSTAP